MSANFEQLEQNRPFSHILTLKCMGLIGTNDCGRGPPIVATPPPQKWSIATVRSQPADTYACVCILEINEIWHDDVINFMR